MVQDCIDGVSSSKSITEEKKKEKENIPNTRKKQEPRYDPRPSLLLLKPIFNRCPRRTGNH